eukprot:TRINITY_DN24906_c0_g2_i1.p1 TRINITY_DN24906_c0_g2~~TRINITY_DN24906_c0_g2_i1.p1  ORF type:complete len:1219 (-),score=249.15 TRINITY_DN24906_c0_g2_i1:121-3777(-)
MAAAKLNRYVQLSGTQTKVEFAPLGTAFKCNISLPGHEHVAHGVAANKKDAQAKAVQDMISYLSATGELDATEGPPAKKKQKVAGGGVKPAASVAAVQQKQEVQKPAVQPPAQNIPKMGQDDGAGNFTLDIARGHLNQELRKMKMDNSTDMTVTTDGPAHDIYHRATLTFYTRDGKRWVESHRAKNKKTVQNELALQVCRKLFALGYIQKYRRNATKGTFWDNVKQSKYFESGSFGLGLQPELKARLRSYLESKGYGVPEPRAPHPGPDAVLWQAGGTKEVPEGHGQVAAVTWSPPGHGSAPWPHPKGDQEPDPDTAAMAAEKSSQLPIASRFEEIIHTVASNQICIIQGSTGSGKTTQVPQYILDAEDGQDKTIVVTQPRRLAAMTVARRVAAERGEALGGSVGYAVRFDTVWPRRPGGICYMTSGLLLKRLHSRGLCGISHVIVDEVHERDLDNDLLMGLLRSAAAAAPGLKIILMSATIDASKFQKYMAEGTAGGLPPVISVEGHCFPVKTLFLEDIIEKMGWHPSGEWNKKGKEKDVQAMNSCDTHRYSQATVKALAACPEQQIPLELTRDLLARLVSEGTVSGETGSVLVFMPTWGMMSLLAKLLQAEASLSRVIKVIMLHSQVPKHEQMEAFRPAPPGIAKVILATNIAESSVTIDDVTVVIDSCKVKLTHFSESTRLSYNDVVWTGRQNMEQRKGRAGRTRPGICFRLCTKLRFEQGLQDEVPPELTRMPLVGAALLIKSLDLGDIAGVLGQCPDAPPAPAVAHAISELLLVRALDPEQNLTYLGRILARLPVDPHVGLALLMGHWLFGLGDAMATMCAAMSFDEPFPFEKTGGYLSWSIQEKFKGSHKNSDQFVLGLVHQEYARLLQVQGQLAADRFCTSEGLHPAIMKQVFDASEQLRAILQSDALGALAVGEDAAEAGAEGILDELQPRQRNYTAIRDWGQQEWQWGAVLLLLATALPFLAVHQEKRHVWVSEEVVGAVYKGSVNCTKALYVFPSPLFAFLDQVKEGGWKPPRCRQLTNIPALLALLKPFAAGEVRLDSEDGSCAIVADWIPVGPVPFETVQLLLGLRCRLEDSLVECAEQISQEGGPAFAEGGGLKDKELVPLLQDLLRHGSLRFRESATGAAAAPGHGTGSAGAWPPQANIAAVSPRAGAGTPPARVVPARGAPAPQPSKGSKGFKGFGKTGSAFTQSAPKGKGKGSIRPATNWWS